MGELLKRGLPCPFDDCGSSDGAAIYLNDDGQEWLRCFVCNRNKPMTEKEQKDAPAGAAKFVADPDRGLLLATLKHYGVDLAEHGGHHWWRFSHPLAAGGSRVKMRRQDAKEFRWAGGKGDPLLFGQGLFSTGAAKYILVTEGQHDALAAYQMLGSKWPVVSIPDGVSSAAAACRRAYEFLDSFERVILAFDADEPGKKAAAEVAALFPGKAWVVKMSPELKDANGYLIAGKTKAFVDAYYGAEQWRPDGIVNAAGLFDRVLEHLQEEALFSWPWPALDAMTDGVRAGELVVLTAGTGAGKSTSAREVVDHILRTSKTLKVGMMMLEESPEDTMLKQLGVRMSLPLHRMAATARRPGATAADRAAFEDLAKGLRKDYDALVSEGRLELFAHFGSSSPDNILARIRYLRTALGCSVVILDHISIVVSGIESDDERKMIDVFLTKLRTLIEETGVTVLAISHLRKVGEGKNHEEGGRVKLSDLRGSGSIAQLSDTVVAWERDGQAADSEVRRKTLARVLKCRHTGEVGPSAVTRYDPRTGRIVYVGPAESPEDGAL